MSHSELCRRAFDAGNGPRQDSNRPTPPRRDILLSPSSSWCEGTHHSSSHAVSSAGCFGRIVLHESSESGFGMPGPGDPARHYRPPDSLSRLGNRYH